MKRLNSPNGYVIHQDKLRVVIATNFKRASKNIKTGDMIQIWIIRKDVNPIEANKTGLDRAICGSCPLKGIKGENRTCYVLLKNAPLAVYKAFKRGSYPTLPSLDVFNGRAVRFGSYGDPAFIPFPLIQAIAARASNWTGYTHQWRNPLFSAYREYVMASVENVDGLNQAHSSGWRTFRVVKDQSEVTTREIPCVNESKGVQCVKCGLCSGTTIKAKSITITVHGNGASNFGTN